MKKSDKSDLFTGLSDTVSIAELIAPDGHRKWALCDKIKGKEIAIDPDEVPEMVAMLEAFRNYCEENGYNLATEKELSQSIRSPDKNIEVP